MLDWQVNWQPLDRDWFSPVIDWVEPESGMEDWENGSSPGRMSCPNTGPIASIALNPKEVPMALLQQWHRQRPWLMAGVAAVGASLGAAMPWNWAASGVISTNENNPWEHPLRQRILQVLDAQPGLAYRELQRELGAANGTLRHHLDVLISNRSITVIPVNGRSCHYAGAPQQIEVLREMNVGNSESAARMMPVGLSGAQRIVVARLMKKPQPKSQAELESRIGTL